MDDWKLQPARDLGLSFHRIRLKSAAREDGLVPDHHALRVVVAGALCQFAVWHRPHDSTRENLPQDVSVYPRWRTTRAIWMPLILTTLPWWLRAGTCPLAAGDVFC